MHSFEGFTAPCIHSFTVGFDTLLKKERPSPSEDNVTSVLSGYETNIDRGGKHLLNVCCGPLCFTWSAIHSGKRFGDSPFKAMRLPSTSFT